MPFKDSKNAGIHKKEDAVLNKSWCHFISQMYMTPQAIASLLKAYPKEIGELVFIVCFLSFIKENREYRISYFFLMIANKVKKKKIKEQVSWLFNKSAKCK